MNECGFILVKVYLQNKVTVWSLLTLDLKDTLKDISTNAHVGSCLYPYSNKPTVKKNFF